MIRILIAALAWLALLATAPVRAEPELLPLEQAFRLSAQVVDRITVEVRFDIAWQQLDGCAQARHRAHQRLLNGCSHRGRAPERPARGHVHVQVDKAPLPRSAAGDMVEADRVMLETSERLFDFSHYFGLECFIHQALRRFPQQRGAFAQDVQRNADGDRRVEPVPVRERYQRHPDDHAR